MSLKTIGYCLAALLAWTSLASAQSVTLLPSKSNTLIQVASASDPQLSNGLGDIYVGRTNQDGQEPATISIRRGLIAFDIADNIPAGATITGVTLTVDDVRGLNGDQAVSLSRMFRDWGQGTSYFDGGQGAPATNGDATWYYTFYNAANPSASPMWTVPGGQPGVDYSATASATSEINTGNPNQLFSWSSTASPLMLTDVQEWLDNPGTNFGWIMLGNESAGQTAKRFGGQSAVAPETPPQLTVQYDVPWIWSGSAGSGWTLPGNWTAGAGFPGAGAAIVLGASSSIGGTVNLGSASPSVSHLTFEASRTITVTSSSPAGGQLTLDNGSSPAAVVVSGSGHLIDGSVDISLDSNAWITTSGSGDSLEIAGNVSDGNAAHAIVKYGLGTLILSGDDTYTGGTSVDAGTLILASSDALPAGTSLTIGAGGTVVFDPSLAAASACSLTTASDAAAAVPEPASLALLAIGAALAAFATIVRRKTMEKSWN